MTQSRSAPQQGTFLDTALELLSHAINAEDDQDYPEAYGKYMAALDYLMAAQKSETNEKSRIFLKTKTDEYLNRAETIKHRVGIDARKQSNGLGTALAAGNLTAQSVILDEAFKCVKQAIYADTSQNYPEAYKQYIKSMDYFMFAQRYELNEQSKSLIRSEVEEYLSRAEIIKKYLDSLKDSEATNNNNLTGSEGPPRSPETVFLLAAIEISERAVQQDVKKNYRSAYELYNGAFDYFMLAQKYERNDELKVAIRANMEEYLARAEALKNCIS